MLIILFVVSTLIIVAVPLAYDNYIRFMISGLFGFLGTYLRYLLSKKYNNRYPHFPLGTFFANILGCWIFAISITIVKFKIEDFMGKSIFFAIIMGFCGCLTTVSTYINELSKLPFKSKYIYAIATNGIA